MGGANVKPICDRRAFKAGLPREAALVRRANTPAIQTHMPLKKRGYLRRPDCLPKDRRQQSEGRHALTATASLTESSMNRIAASFAAYSGTVIMAAAATAVMSGVAQAETPTIDTTPFVSTRTRDEVRAEVLNSRQKLSAAGTEWAMQKGEPLPMSGYTRAQATAEYIAARDQVHAMNSEGGGTQFAQVPVRPGNLMIAQQRRAD